MRGQSLPWRNFLCELIGTALLVLAGLSLVILMFGTGTPVARIVPNEAVRRFVTGFLFGTTGAMIAISGLGKVSGAHINPVVTLAFWLFRKIEWPVFVGYTVAQLVGGVIGCLPLLAWGTMGQSIGFGVTLPGAGYSTWAVLIGEIVTTFTMVSLLTVFIGFRSSRPFTPWMFPILYAIMVCIEAPISGTSTNPARSLGPSVISGSWHGWWIYWVGPAVGAVLAALACSLLAKRIQVAKLYHFDSNRDWLFRRESLAGRMAGSA